MQFDTNRRDFEPYGFTCVSWTPTPMPRPDRHNEVEINFLGAGSVTYLFGGRRTKVEAGRMVMFWAAIPHQILQWESQRSYAVATLPLAWFLARGFPERLTHRILAGEIVVDPIRRHEDDSCFQQWVDDFESDNLERERAAQVELQARMLRVAIELPASSNRRTSSDAHAADPALSRADSIACHIALHYAEPLTSRSIAEAVGLHPNYAMALFRKAFGVTITEFIVQHRLCHAQRLLVTTGDSILDVALSSGFQSLSRFNEAFKRAFNCAPRDYRKAHQLKA